MKNKKLSTGILLGMAMGAVHADNEGLKELLDVLKKNDTLTQQQHEQLRQAVSQDEQEVQNVEVNTQGGINISSLDKHFSFRLGGRVMVDNAFYYQDKNPLGNGTKIRRARLEMKGKLFTDWHFVLNPEIGSDENVNLTDAYIRYEGLSPVKILIGQFKAPFSIEQQTSNRHITFMERSLMDVFAPGRSVSLGAMLPGKNWMLAAGISGEDSKTDAPNEGNEGWGMLVRGSYAPFYSDTRVLHFGLGACYRNPNDEKTVRFRTRPESYVTDIKYVDTGVIGDVHHFNRYILETAGVLGPFSLQGEYTRAEVNRDDSFSDLAFNAWYLYGSWFLTGESRPYLPGKGGFWRVKPKSNWGAWELAARYSVLDLNDGFITGGEEKNMTFGINWYINEQVRLTANYIIVDNDQNANADGNVLGNDDPTIFQMRMQMEF